MNSAGMFWLVAALVGLLLVVMAFRKEGLKKDGYKGLINLGGVFVLVGLFEKLRYDDWGWLPFGVILLVVGWVMKSRKGKKRK